LRDAAAVPFNHAALSACGSNERVAIFRFKDNVK